jgi:polyphenol oxidase
MPIHKTSHFTIYFGDATDAIDKKIHCLPSGTPLVEHDIFKPVARHLELQHLALLNQTHSVTGFTVKKEIPAFNYDGDFLMTDQKNIGIGVMGADCLPIIFYDEKHCAAAIAHAGWKGSVAGIAQKTVEQMRKGFETDPRDLQIFLGPCAKVCCYQVSGDFYKNLANSETDTIINRNNQYSFDLPEFNIRRLEALGISRELINQTYNQCTMCNPQFLSARLQGERLGRQMTIISLSEVNTA